MAMDKWIVFKNTVHALPSDKTFVAFNCSTVDILCIFLCGPPSADNRRVRTVNVRCRMKFMGSNVKSCHELESEFHCVPPFVVYLEGSGECVFCVHTSNKHEHGESKSISSAKPFCDVWVGAPPTPATLLYIQSIDRRRPT